MNKDLYNILGVDKKASKEEIKKAFKKLAVKYHPDKQQGKSDSEKKEAEDKFKEINEAYSILSDDEKRRNYDMGGLGDFSGFQDNEDLFSMFRNMHNMGFSGFSGFSGFGGFGGFSNEPQRVIINGTDIKIKLECTIEDVYNNSTKTIKYSRKVVCHNCNGTGSSDGKLDTCPYCNGTGIEKRVSRMGNITTEHNSICSHCNGSGKIAKNKCKNCNGTGLETIKETIQIDITKNVRTGSVITIPGMGNMSTDKEGTPGDLIVLFNVNETNGFTIGSDFVTLNKNIDINILDCVTGCTREVKTIKGNKITVDIPMGTKHGDKIICKGYGMPNSEVTYGDMAVIVNQIFPNKLTTDETNKIKELKKSKNFK